MRCMYSEAGMKQLAVAGEFISDAGDIEIGRIARPACE